MGAKRCANACISGERNNQIVKPHLQHLKSGKRLETPYEAIRAGFVALALEKNRRATPFVAEARALKTLASKARSPRNLLNIPDIQLALLTAAGVSDKAANHLQDSDKHEAIDGLIKNFLEPAGINFIEELVFRFLLTRGDTLGGSMRNIGGFMAQKRLTRAIIAYLKLSRCPCQWLRSGTNAWAKLPEDDADVELSLRGLCWDTGKGSRTLLYNVTVPLFQNNVDLSLFNCSAEDLTREVIKTPSAYIALGELKGGIDPAGADEHWKTARTALNRIHEAFLKRKLKPHTFFIGAAIETKMAKEIWEMLKKGKLENAANLTDEDQIASVSEWLCTL
ncbi:MAG: restriction endonuclease [Nitrospirae bacterium]|nr:restriction endonuclease [Candidatus Troglogloeales bacterium]